MSRAAYILSTVTSDIRIVNYKTKGIMQNDVPVIERALVIKGGANNADKRLHTPEGVLTPVDREQLQFLMNNTEFQRQIREGYMTIIEDDRDEGRARRDLHAKDGCAPLVDGDKRLDKAREVYIGDRLPDGDVKAA